MLDCFFYFWNSSFGWIRPIYSRHKQYQVRTFHQSLIQKCIKQYIVFDLEIIITSFNVGIFYYIFPSCAPHWGSRLMLGMLYNCSLMILAFFIPTLIIIVTNAIVIVKLHMVRTNLTFLKADTISATFLYTI